MKQYLTELFSDAKDVGRAILRPLFMDFSISDPYTIENTEQLKGQYMFGPRVMVAPVTDDGVTTSKVYLPELPSDAPASEWTYWWTNATYDGGQWVGYIPWQLCRIHWLTTASYRSRFPHRLSGMY